MFGKSKRSLPFLAAGGRLMFLPGNSCYHCSFSHNSRGIHARAPGSGNGHTAVELQLLCSLQNSDAVVKVANVAFARSP